MLVAGVLSIGPTWFLLKLAIDKAPRLLLAALLAIASMGPLSWLAVISANDAANGPQSILLGLFVVFAALPRIVAGPILLAIEALALFLMRRRTDRILVAVAMLIEVIPLGVFAWHLASVR